MIRKQVYLEAKHERELKRMARQSAKTEATIIREALDRLISETRLDKERMEAWNAERAFIDQWAAKGPVPGGQPRWRREDLTTARTPASRAGNLIVISRVGANRTQILAEFLVTVSGTER